MTDCKRKQVIVYGVIITVSIVLGVVFVMLAFMGVRLIDANPYNTYALQADAWRRGMLDLGQDYPWLELAIYNEKYFCSFPPFPSYILLPFTFIFGSNTPDYFLLIGMNILACIYLYKLAVKIGATLVEAGWWTVFITLGSNTLFIMLSPSVWFFAQMMCFTTAVMAFYYAREGKGGVSLFFWAASVGCRPMQVLFLPILLFIMYRAERAKEKDLLLSKRILRRWYWVMPMGILAVSYMALNYLRFGSIIEFGHNYLPEFVRAEKGQFHIDYLKQNFLQLFQLPQFDDNGMMVISHFGGLSILIVNPIIVAMMIGIIYGIWKKDKQLVIVPLIIVCISTTYLIFIASHRTLGGWHFGNRYAIDILPYVYAGTIMMGVKLPKLIRYSVPLMMWGICLNIFGTLIVYIGL